MDNREKFVLVFKDKKSGQYLKDVVGNGFISTSDIEAAMSFCCLESAKDNLERYGSLYFDIIKVSEV